ncbi:histidine-type phosphatase [bacterium]|nr:histidine-type phosphatase [bacterium]
MNQSTHPQQVRDENGKERRFPVRLNSQEKMYASKIVLAFKQNVCGFDILRTDDLSYVCDVNGWSMVKNSPKYWDDCSHILTEIILQTLDPSCLQRRKKRSGSASDKSSTTSTKSSILNKPQSLKRSQSTMQAELRCVIGVFRHGDRTPKQKMKMKTSNITVLSLFHRYCNKKYGQGLKSEYHRRTRNDNSATVMNSETRSIYEREVLLRTASELQDVLDMARTLLRDIRVAEDESDNSDSELPVAKLIQLKTVCNMFVLFFSLSLSLSLSYPLTHTHTTPGPRDVRRIQRNQS